MRGPYSWLSGGWKPSSEDTDSPSELMGPLGCPKGRTRRWCQEGEVSIIFPPPAVWAPVLAGSDVSLPPCHHPPFQSFPNPSRGGEGTGLLGAWTGAWGGGASREHRAQQGPGRLSQPDVCVKVQPWAKSPGRGSQPGLPVSSSKSHCSGRTKSRRVRTSGRGPSARCCLQRAARADRCCLRRMVCTHPSTCGRERGSPRDQSPAHLSIY